MPWRNTLSMLGVHGGCVKHNDNINSNNINNNNNNSNDNSNLSLHVCAIVLFHFLSSIPIPFIRVTKNFPFTAFIDSPLFLF
mmetsp:Transcript_28420/g.84138  ORF Transcript_28420/g.84138 Transcript_28420/m.84138 type:complete len:82 (-) Transcript_28420:566-811(-)